MTQQTADSEQVLGGNSTTPPPPPPPPPTIDNIAQLLQHDTKVKVAGIDCDGQLRGKIMCQEKFLSSVEKGFGMSSAIYGWDMHDRLYTTETSLSSSQEGYADFTAIPDLSSFRRIPSENNIPFFLLRFVSKQKAVSADGRSMLQALSKKIALSGWKALAGVELEFMNFQTPSQNGYTADKSPGDICSFLTNGSPASLRQISSGMFGYSVARPVANKGYFHDVFDKCSLFRCNVEGWHTESGPGVYEAALRMNEISEMADRVALFKFLTRTVGIEYDITPCFMAKPIQGLPGNSGHIHISLCDSNGKNLFARDSPDPTAQWPDIAHLSDLGRQFLAGVLYALPDIMPLFAPTINSYKRLVENYWAPVHISWGLEDRLSSIRLIAPPVSSASATRFEIRIPGADMHPHYALSTILAAGLRGIEKKLEIPVPPASVREDKPVNLPNSLELAVERFKRPGSVAFELFDSEFVEFFAATREHELRVWREAVTDWEFKRYIETV